MSTASTASMGLLTSSRQQPRRDDDIGSLCRNASPSRKGAFSSSVVVSANAQHARFIATTIYRTCGIVVTSARLTTHSSGPSSFYPTLGVCLGPNRPRRCRRGGRSSIIGDALISPGSSTPRAYLSGSPRPRPRPPEISTCCGLSRPRRRRRAARHLNTGCSLHGRPSPCQLSRLSRPRAVVYSRGLLYARVALVPCDAAITGRAVRDRSLPSNRVGLEGPPRQRRHGFAPSLVRAAYCLRASPLPQATPRTRVARSATAGCDKLLSVSTLEGWC